LEVMMSVAILGLVLTVILSAQGGLVASNKMAGNMGVAIGAARCKMSETEERLLKLGYSEIDQVDTGIPCCEDLEMPGFTCDVRVEKVELPGPPQNTLGDGGMLSLSGASSAGPLGVAPPDGGLPGLTPGAGLNLAGAGDGGLQGLGASVAQSMGMGAGGAGGGSEGLLQMAMGFVYPSLKPILESSIRRITVTVHWKEGPNARDFTLLQYVTNPQKAGLMSGVPTGPDLSAPNPAPTGTGGPLR
jgi:general secretion pathway protein I